MRRYLVATLVSLACIGVATLCDAANDPIVTITPSKITVSGATPNANILFFGAGFEPKDGQAIVHRWASVVSANGSHGDVSYDLNPVVNWNALWIIADLANGHYTILSTPGFRSHHALRPKRAFKHGPGGAVNRFTYARSEVYALYLHPGGSAWTLRATDGDSTDADGTANGTTEIDLTSLQPLVNGGNAPSAFAPGGILFIIDPSRLDVLELKIDGSMLAGAH
jgi:hypothetical protein